MVDQIHQLKNQIWHAKQKVEKEEAKRLDWEQQMVAVQDFLKADPENADFLKIQAELEEGLAAATEALEPLLANLAALEAKLPKAPEPVVPKFDREKHPVLKKAVEKTEVAKAVVLKPGDICEALWRHDKLWYKAKILSMLGSASAPKYHVRFLDYDETVTVDRDAVRPLQSKRKHEAEPTLAPTPASHNTPVTSTPHVISGPVSVNPNAQVVKQNPPSEVMEPKKRHKIPNKKALEKGVNSWKDWNSKGVGKKLSQKESMFRSGTTVNSRVGFTGSGAGMTETNKRMRYNKAEAEADDFESGNFSKKRARH